jgi:hypothetical protein
MQSAGSQSKVTAPAKAGAGHFKVLRALGGAALLSGLVLAGALVVAGDELDVPEAQAHEATGVVPYRDGPPLGFSGGFGEDHCQACHNSEKLNVSPGTVTISAPERYSPGKVYTVTVTLKRPGLKAGGFMFTARFEDDSTQAGTLALGDGQQGRIKIVDDRGIQYAYHSRAGTELTGTHTVRWTLRWTAPEGNRAVLFHVASNAANADDTPSGDFIYTSRTRSRGR